MPRQVTHKWGSFTDLRDLEQETLCCCCCQKPSTTTAATSTSSAPPTPPPPPPPATPPPYTLSPHKHAMAHEHRRMSEPRQVQQGGLQRNSGQPNRHRPLTRLTQLQREGEGGGSGSDGSSMNSTMARYSLSPPRLFLPADLPPAGRLRRVFTTHTRRRKKHGHGFQLSSLMKEPLRVVHSVPLCFPEG